MKGYTRCTDSFVDSLSFDASMNKHAFLWKKNVGLANINTEKAIAND